GSPASSKRFLAGSRRSRSASRRWRMSSSTRPATASGSRRSRPHDHDRRANATRFPTTEPWARNLARAESLACGVGPLLARDGPLFPAAESRRRSDWPAGPVLALVRRGAAALVSPRRRRRTWHVVPGILLSRHVDADPAVYRHFRNDFDHRG